MESKNKVISGMGFAHIALKASDFEKSLHFYEALGMTPCLSWGEGDGRITMLELGDGGILELFAGGSKEEECGKFIHFAMSVDDVNDAYIAALAAGARPKTEPKVVALDSQPVQKTLNVAFVYGPDGEELEFFRFV